MLDKYEAYLKNRKSPATTRNYLNTIQRYLLFIKGGSPTEDKAEEFLNSMSGDDVSPRSLNRHLSALKSFFKIIMKHELILEGFRFEKTLPTWLDLNEQNQLIAGCETLYEKAVIMTLLGSGLRVSEAAGLTVGRIDAERNQLKVMGKGGKERIVPVQPLVIEVIRDYLSSRRFSSRVVFPRGTKSIQRVVKEVAKRAGISKKVTPHTLRHSYGSLWIRKGGALIALRDMMGHTNIATTDIYTHTTVDEIQKDMPKILDELPDDDKES